MSYKISYRDEKGKVETIPIKVTLLKELRRCISRGLDYVEYYADNHNAPKVEKDFNDLESHLKLLEMQIKLGVQYAKYN